MSSPGAISWQWGEKKLVTGCCVTPYNLKLEAKAVLIYEISKVAGLLLLFLLYFCTDSLRKKHNAFPSNLCRLVNHTVFLIDGTLLCLTLPRLFLAENQLIPTELRREALALQGSLEFDDAGGEGKTVPWCPLPYWTSFSAHWASRPLLPHWAVSHLTELSRRAVSVPIPSSTGALPKWRLLLFADSPSLDCLLSRALSLALVPRCLIHCII